MLSNDTEENVWIITDGWEMGQNFNHTQNSETSVILINVLMTDVPLVMDTPASNVGIPVQSSVSHDVACNTNIFPSFIWPDTWWQAVDINSLQEAT